MKTLNESSFKLMPWKNGRGVTTELFREDIHDQMAFRLSRATIKENGAFSIFRGLKRILVILTGEGCNLEMNGSFKTLRTEEIFDFDGSESVNASLLKDEVSDFNVFYDPDIYHCKVSWVKHVSIMPDFRAYLYSVDEHKLIILESLDEFFVEKKMILVELKKAH